MPDPRTTWHPTSALSRRPPRPPNPAGPPAKNSARVDSAALAGKFPACLKGVMTVAAPVPRLEAGPLPDLAPDPAQAGA